MNHVKQPARLRLLRATCVLAGLSVLAGCGQKSKSTPKSAPSTEAPRPAPQPEAAQGAAAKQAAADIAAAEKVAAKLAALKAAARKARKQAEAARNKPEQIGGVTITKRDEGPWKLRTLPGKRAAFSPVTPDADRPKKVVDDNAEFSSFLKYLAAWKRRPIAAGQFKYLKVDDRRSVHVRDVKGGAVPMAVVDLKQLGKIVWRARTYGDGRFFFYPAMARAKPGQPWSASTVALVSRGKGQLGASAESVTLKLPGENGHKTIQLDMALVVDTTASMKPALKMLQPALLNALKRLNALGAKLDLKIGAVAYRDVGEAYLTKRLPMSGNLTQTLERMGTLEAAGGGDTADSLDQGLYIAIDQLSWRRDSAKVVFVLTDAAPKPSTAGDQDHTVSAIRAAAMGIRIHSLALEGHDALGTLALRQLAQMACGQFIPLPKPAAPSLQGRLADIIFGRLRAEVQGWQKPQKR